MHTSGNICFISKTVMTKAAGDLSRLLLELKEPVWRDLVM